MNLQIFFRKKYHNYRLIASLIKELIAFANVQDVFCGSGLWKEKIFLSLRHLKCGNSSVAVQYSANG